MQDLNPVYLSAAGRSAEVWQTWAEEQRDRRKWAADPTERGTETGVCKQEFIHELITPTMAGVEEQQGRLMLPKPQNLERITLWKHETTKFTEFEAHLRKRTLLFTENFI